ncbi:unnamed protein product [Agarophyton chilense]
MPFFLQTFSLPSVILFTSRRTSLWAAAPWLRTTKRAAPRDTKWLTNVPETSVIIPSDQIRRQCVTPFSRSLWKNTSGFATCISTPEGLPRYLIYGGAPKTRAASRGITDGCIVLWIPVRRRDVAPSSKRICQRPLRGGSRIPVQGEQTPLRRIQGFISPHVDLPPAGHNLSALMCFRPTYDHLFLISNRVYWNEMHEPDGRLNQSLGFFFGWHHVGFHDMSTDKRLPLCLSLPHEDENQWAIYWRFLPLLLVPTLSVVAYHSSQLMGDDNDRRSWLLCQVLFVEFGLMSLMAFLDTAKYGIRGIVRSEDWRVWYDENIPGPRGRLIPLPDIMIRFLKNLGIRNIFRGSQFDVEETEALLDHVLQVEWRKTPDFLRYDQDTDSLTPIPLHQLLRQLLIRMSFLMSRPSPRWKSLLESILSRLEVL